MEMKYRDSIEAMRRLKRQKELRRINRIEKGITIIVSCLFAWGLYLYLKYYGIL